MKVLKYKTEKKKDCTPNSHVSDVLFNTHQNLAKPVHMLAS